MMVRDDLKLPLEGCRQGWRRASEPQDVSESLKWSALADRKGDLTRVKLLLGHICHCEALKTPWQSRKVSRKN